MKTLYEMFVNGTSLSLPHFLLAPYRSLPLLDLPAPSSGSGDEITLQINPSDEFGLRAAPLPTVHSILLHGSRALNDAVPFSDTDALIVLDDSQPHSQRELIGDIVRLRKLCCTLYSLDPLMHHGLMFLNASDLRAYDESFLPVATLAESRSLYGETRLRIRPQPNPPLDFCRRRFFDSVRNLCAYDFSPPPTQQDFILKWHLSGILLLPALFLAAHGRFVHKRDSFAIAYGDYPNLRWDVVKTAERMRSDWQAVAIHPLHRLALHAFSCKARGMAARYYRQNYRRHAAALPFLLQQLRDLGASAEAAL